MARLGVFFSAIKITKYTDKMFHILNEAYKSVTKKEFPIKELGSGGINMQEFTTFISTSISSSISNST